MMQAWLTSPDWLVWQGTPSTETTGLTGIGSVILRLEELPFRSSFFFNGLWLFICQAVYDRPDDWQQWWSWGCIKLQTFLFQHLVLTFSNKRLYKFNTFLIVCLWMDREQPSGFSACQAKLAECPNSMLPHTALFVLHE